MAIFPFFNPQFSLPMSNMDMLNIVTVLNSTIFTGSEAEVFLPLGSAFVVESSPQLGPLNSIIVPAKNSRVAEVIV